MTAFRWLALVAVVAISVFIMWRGWTIVDILAAPDWCARAIGADRAIDVEPRVDAMTGCLGLLTVQLRSLAMNSHILMGTLALCLLTIVVVQVAEARVSGAVDGSGARGEIAPKDATVSAPAAAQAVADEAQAKADEIIEAAPDDDAPPVKTEEPPL